MKYLIIPIAFFVFIIVSDIQTYAGAKGGSKNIRPETKPAIIGQGDQAAGKPTFLTKETFLKKIWDYTVSPKEWKYKGTKPAIIDFYADWCGPCRKASPILEKISIEYAGKIEVYKINTDKEQELASVFGIKGIPSFLYIPAEGKPVMSSGIGQSDEETKEMFVGYINKYLLKEK